MAMRRVGEVRLIYVLILLVVVGGIAVVALGFTGYIAVGWFNQKNLNQLVNEGVDTAAGYTPAKTPTEAMDKFRDAIQKRNYIAAKKYVTKDYADMLERAHTAARELGTDIDKISQFAKNNSFETDKLRYFLLALDPFPKNFSSGTPPEQKGDKAYGSYKWEKLGGHANWKELAQELDQFEKPMYQKVLAPSAIFENQIELVKEGEDWKLSIPTNKGWEEAVAFYIDREKAHHNGLDSFATEMSRLRIDNARQFEAEVFTKLRNAKK